MRYISSEISQLLNKADSIATKYNETIIGEDHIFMAMHELYNDVVVNILNNFGISIEKFLQELSKYRITYYQSLTNIKKKYSPTILKIWNNLPNNAIEFFIYLCINDKSLLNIIFSDLCPYFNMQTLEKSACEAVKIHNEKINKKNNDNLNIDIGINYNELVKNNKIGKVVGRYDELNQVMEILSRKNKCNPCLIGEPGIGKTAIVEGLAYNIVNNKVPKALQNKKIIELHIGDLIANTRYRGELEGKIKNILNNIEKDENIILFIDEIHTIISAGSDTENGMNVANILKPVLARGKIKLIGATTLEEYRKTIEKDGALNRRFNVVNVKEPTEKESIYILNQIKSDYEKFHKISISEENVNDIVKLSNKYITNNFLPDKAIDILDQTCARLKLKNKNEFNLKDIAITISKRTGIDKNIILSNKVVDNVDKVKKEIIGQDKHIDDICLAIKKHRLGFNDKPVSFLLCGKIGIGKTYTASIISKYLYSNSDMVTINMSEYSDRHSISKLIGTTAGYVGYNDSGILFKKLKYNRNCVLLFDNIDKAHPDISNLVLQMIKDGYIEDSNGNKIDVKNCLMLMTCDINVNNNIGFNSTENKLDKYLRPEFTNNINVLYYDDLNEEQVKTIIRNKMLNLKGKLNKINIKFNINDEIIDDIYINGFKNNIALIDKYIQDNYEDKYIMEA